MARPIPSHYLWVLGKGREDWILLRGARWHGKVRRKNSDWQISHDRDVHSAIEACSSFFHGNGTELWRYLNFSFREMEVNLSTKSRETLPALFQSQTGVNGRNSGSDAFKIYCLFTLKVQILWLVIGNFQINGSKKSRYRFRNFLLFEKTILSLKKDFNEWFVKFIIVDERYIVHVSEKVSSVGHKLTV